MRSSNIYEVYLYCDPRYPGVYRYGGYCFFYKPIYVGKGSQKWKRKFTHTNKSSNHRLKNTIYKLKSNNILPIIITIVKAISENRAHIIEKELINIIGREDQGRGPLFNFTDGGEGLAGKFFSKKEREQRSLNTKKYFNSLTPEQLKQHGQKSLKNRNPQRVKMGKRQEIITKKSKPLCEKTRIEEQRYLSWSKTYYSRSEEDKKTTSIRCSIASNKRPQYFITIQNLNTNITEAKFLNDWIKEGFARDGIMYRIKGKSSEPLFSRTKKQLIRIINVEKKVPLAS